MGWVLEGETLPLMTCMKQQRSAAADADIADAEE
jgi:hypothetical protein